MKKIIGIFIMTLLIGTAIPTIGIINEPQQKARDYFENEFVSGEFIVKFKEPPIYSVSVENLNEKHQVKSIEKVFKNHEDTIIDNIYLLEVSEDTDILSIVGEYNSLPNVVYAEPNRIVHVNSIPNDEFFEEQWHLHNTGQTGGTEDADIDAPEAWDIETGSEDIIIAVIDTGVDWDHPDLDDNIWINSDETIDGTDSDGNGFIDDIRGWDFVNEDNDPDDDYGHGTVCSGIASAVSDNAIGVSGVCWNCKIMNVKCLGIDGWGTEIDTSQSIIYAVDNGADIISLSWGDYPILQLEKDAVDYAYSKGIVTVAAAGNENTNEIFYPAAYDTAISVAATDENDKKAWFSTYGSWVDVAAPGLNIYSTYFGDSYASFDGTSTSTPVVAGVVGLMLSRNDSLSPDEN